VFIVHRNDIVRASLQMILQDSCKAHEITSIEEAVKKGSSQKVNLVLLDAMIVRDNGVADLAFLTAKLPGARILLVGPTGEDAFLQECLQAGAAGVLNPPFRLDAVRQKIDQYLSMPDAVSKGVRD
jgi:DNA-binding NarL/FixJ family response regulator